MKQRVRVRIDVGHTLDLLDGKPVAIAVPKGCEVLEIQLHRSAVPPASNSFAKLVDVFFNGRRA
jgi:hypothetical protein